MSKFATLSVHLHIVCIFFFSFFSQNFLAQRNIVRVDGIVQEEKNKLDKVSITIYENEQFVTKELTEPNGKFRFQLNYDTDYIMEFSKPGYVTKKFSVNTEGVSTEDQDFGHEYGGWNVVLFRADDGMDVSMFNKPFAKIYYNEDTKKFEHDAEYTGLVKKEFAQLQKDFEKKKKEEKKRKKEEEKATAAAAVEKKTRQKEDEKKKSYEGKYMWSNENFNSAKANKAKRDTGVYKTIDEFLQELTKLYSQGVTEEIYMEGNVKVTRRIVVDGNTGNEYKFTEHPWGGKFWFKNGTSVNESVWNVETQLKK